MNATDISEFLATVAPFSELERETIDNLAGYFSERSFAGGEEIGTYRQPGRHGLFVIRTGAVAILDENGQELEQRGQGELFGHAIALDSGVRDYSVRAIENCQLFHLDAGILEQFSGEHDIVRRFLTAGPGERLRSLAQPSTGTLADIELRQPVTASADTTIARCAALMASHQVSCLPITAGEKLVGIVTDRDLRTRVLAAGIDPSIAIDQVMTHDPLAARLATRIDDALVEMMRLGIHHLPVRDESGRLAAVVSAGDLLRLQAPHPLRLVRDIQRAEAVDNLARLARKGPGLLASLAGRGSEVTEVGRIASMITDACTKRLLQLAQQRLGQAPMEWTWLAFGSQARMEQGLISDQDNGLLLAEAPDEPEAQYFQRLAEFVCDGLADCGYIYCPGDVMAKSKWRMSFAQWRRTFEGWMLEPEPQSVMNSSIFFDMRAVAGDLDLGRKLHAEVLDQARESKLFRRFLAAESMQHRPPLGFFGRLVQESSEDKGHGINLKKRGVLPIVDLARVRALEGAIRVVHTEERIQAAAQVGIMNERDADDLVHAFRFIGNIRLKHQVALYERGDKPDHLVDPDELSGLHRRYLRSAFGIVRTAQKALAQRYQV
jgi:CBS domain-containing protein